MRTKKNPLFFEDLKIMRSKMTSADIGKIPIKIKFRQINRILLDLSEMKTLIQKMK